MIAAGSNERAKRGASRRGALILLAVACGFSWVVPAKAWERSDVLSAIHQVENPRDTLRIGRRGELGPFQFRPAVWSCYTGKPFSLAADAAEAQLVAEAHYDWIKRGLERNGLAVTPFSIGLAWNAGLMATVNNRVHEQSRQYAQRVANLVESMEAERNAAAGASPAAQAGETPRPPAG